MMSDGHRGITRPYFTFGWNFQATNTDAKKDIPTLRIKNIYKS